MFNHLHDRDSTLKTYKADYALDDLRPTLIGNYEYVQLNKG